MVTSQIEKKPKKLLGAKLLVFLVGSHSILLGLTIYFFTDYFYNIFFNAGVENVFFVRQSGIFLFLAGLFYLYPLTNLKDFYNLILLVIFSKIVAVIFLISNAEYTTSPLMIYLAAFFDGTMALVLTGVYIQVGKSVCLANNSIIRADKTRAEEVA